MMKIAVIGAGISGLTAAYVLSRTHKVTVFEAENRLGGHTATIDVHHKGKDYSIDTGFIVFNDWTYPNFKVLLGQLGVEYQPTTMGFSVTCENTGLEYSGTNLNTLFAQRRNLLNVKHWQMIRDILRFNKEALIDVEQGSAYGAMTLGDYLVHKSYSKAFMDSYLIPMGAAIWSATTSVIKNFPLQFFVRFFKNHGLLSVKHRPQWHVIKGGSRSYLEPLTQSFTSSIHLNSPIVSIVRSEQSVEVQVKESQTESFDHVIIACHSDQALAMLGDASDLEQSILGAIPYQINDVVLHTDERLLPRNRLTWSSWNYRLLKDNVGDGDDQHPPVLTYDMNILQSIEAADRFCVTLNKTEAIDSDKIIGHYQYAHPVFSLEGIDAQQRWSDINGVNRTWFCGAYWANGFHEDGVTSALKVTQALGESL